MIQNIYSLLQINTAPSYLQPIFYLTAHDHERKQTTCSVEDTITYYPIIVILPQPLQYSDLYYIVIRFISEVEYS